LWRASKIVTSYPIFARSAAAVNPAGPEPMTATFFPLLTGGLGWGGPPCSPNCPPANPYTNVKPVSVDELIKRIAPPPVPPSAPGGTETRVKWKQG